MLKIKIAQFNLLNLLLTLSIGAPNYKNKDQKLKQVLKIRKLQNRHLLPTFHPKFQPLGQVLNIKAPMHVLKMCALNYSRPVLKSEGTDQASFECTEWERTDGLSHWFTVSFIP